MVPAGVDYARGRRAVVTPSRVLSTSRNSVVSSRSTAVRHDHRPCARRRDCRRGKDVAESRRASGVDAIVARLATPARDREVYPRGVTELTPELRAALPTSPLASWSARDVAACVRVLGREFAREEGESRSGDVEAFDRYATPSWRTASTARSCRA